MYVIAHTYLALFTIIYTYFLVRYISLFTYLSTALFVYLPFLLWVTVFQYSILNCHDYVQITTYPLTSQPTSTFKPFSKRYTLQLSPHIRYYPATFLYLYRTIDIRCPGAHLQHRVSPAQQGASGATERRENMVRRLAVLCRTQQRREETVWSIHKDTHAHTNLSLPLYSLPLIPFPSSLSLITHWYAYIHACMCWYIHSYMHTYIS